jgi:phytoene dehydrogenase-like protein
VTEDEYPETCRRLAAEMIERIGEKFGKDLRPHIEEVVIETPMSVARYVGAWRGGIYGYRHSQDDNIVARLEMREKDNYIKNLYFNGASSMSGNGMSPVITNGIDAAKDVLNHMKKQGGAK